VQVASNEPLDVLVVDDDADVGSSTAEVLRAAGLSVLSASSVGQALDFCRARAFRAVVLDHMMAGLDGEQLLERTSDLAAAVVVSASRPNLLAEIQDRHPGRVFAARSKPVPPSELIAVVRAAMARTDRLRRGPAMAERPSSGRAEEGGGL